MKIFLLICLASGLASSEKLDRSYLPPPGSKFSGGSPGDIEVPLEFPKETYSTGRPQMADGKPNIELGINRRPAPTGAPDSQKPGFNRFQNAYTIPKTTTSYAITQTTTFDPTEDYDGIYQPIGFVNGSTRIQPVFAGQQPIRGPGQAPSYQYRPGQSQPSSVTPYGTTARPLFPGLQKGLEYLPPAPSTSIRGQSPGRVSSQDGFSYPSGQPQGPKYQDGKVSINQPGYVTPGFNQQNQYVGNQDTPSSTAAPQYQDGRFGLTGLGSQQGSQFPSSTAAPQYQAGQRLTTPGSTQQNQYPGNQDFPTSTTGPQFQTGQRFTTPGLNQQQLGARLPNQQNQYTGNQYQGNLGFPSSTIAPTPGSIQQNQFAGNQPTPSTVAPNYQTGQHFTTPGQNQGGIPNQQIQNQYTGSQKFPSTSTAPQFQDRERFITPGFVQESYGSPEPTQQNQNQYPGNQNVPSSTAAPQFQSNQQFTTPGPVHQNQYPGNQNFPSTAAPVYQDGQRFVTPGQHQGELVPNQQTIGSRIPIQQNQGQYGGNQNFPSSTSAPQYQDGQRFTTPGSQQRFETPQQNQFPGSQTFPSTTAPQYQDQRFSTPGQQGPLLNQPSFPESTGAPQYQQKFAPTPGSNQQGFIPSQQNQYQRPAFNQQIPSSTTAPDRFVTGYQPYGNDGIQSTPGMAVSFPESQGGLTGGQPGPTYGSTQQPASQTFAGSSVYGTAPTTPSRLPNQGFPTTPIGSLPARDFSSTPDFVGEGRPQRPQTEGDRNAEILSYENVLTPEGYSYSYDTSNGIHADETGTVGDGTKAQGGFSYTGDDGKVYSVFYSADENGFQPRGDHLPTPPPIPEAIQRVIDQANRDKESGIEDDGSYNEDKYGYMKYEKPLTRLKPQNKTVSVVNGVDIPDRTESRVSGPNKKVFKPKGNQLDTEKYSKTHDAEDVESDLDQIDRTEENSGSDVNIDENKNKNRRVGTKRPKPIKNLVVEENRLNKLKGNKTPIKSTTSSKADSLQNTKINKNDPIRRPVTSQEDDEVALDYASDSDISERKDDNDDKDDEPESQGIDYESDLVNYKDDPNNRTDFHGLNRYLPKPKGTNRKNQLSKNRPTVQVDGTKRPVAAVSKVERPGDRNIQPSQETESGYTGETRTRIPSRKNKFGQKINDQSKVPDEPSLESDDKINMYNKDNSNTDDEYGSDDETRTVTTDRTDKQSTAKLNKKTFGKLRRPTENERTGISDNKGIKPSADEEKGYEYTAPQRKFDAEGVIKFPSRTYPQKGIQTTLRPFMTKNVYGDDIEPTDEDIDQYGSVKPGRPGRPITTQKQQYPGFKQDGDSYNESPNSEMNEGDRFASTRKPVGQYGTTSSRRPFGRPQTTAMPQYEGQSMIGEDRYNEPTIQGSQRPGDKVFYNTNAPFRGTSQMDGNVFSSTTPLPSSEPDSFKQYQRPGQYQDRPNKGMYDENAAPGGETYINRPGASRPGQVPSTTYRPNYSFGDRTLAPNGPVTVDGFGRPIQSTNAPFDGTIRPTYSTVRPTKGQPIEEKFRPSVGRFGDTTQGPFGYQSTSAPIGEDFSGPKQPQRFDPESGYYYK